MLWAFYNWVAKRSVQRTQPRTSGTDACARFESRSRPFPPPCQGSLLVDDLAHSELLLANLKLSVDFQILMDKLRSRRRAQSLFDPWQVPLFTRKTTLDFPLDFGRGSESMSLHGW